MGAPRGSAEQPSTKASVNEALVLSIVLAVRTKLWGEVNPIGCQALMQRDQIGVAPA